MNISRGLFRLWIALTVLWLLAVSALLLPNIIKTHNAIARFDRTYGTGPFAAFSDPTVPWDCAQARGVKSDRPNQTPPGTDYLQENGYCMYGITTFKRLFPEQSADVSDQELYDRLWWTYGQGTEYYPRGLPPDPSGSEWTAAAIAFGPPVSVLLLGLITIWIIRGFRSDS